MTVKKRLDSLILERNTHYSRSKIQALIKAGSVLVNNQVITKPGALVTPNIDIEILTTPRYVSRAGCKLEKALDYFALDLTNLVALDAGISTGGFTDCLLQRNIKKVYGIEVGSNQTHASIKNNPRVILLENTNLRTLAPEIIGERVDLVTLDLSFISVLKVMPAVTNLLKQNGKLIVLIKPQFESEGKYLNKQGVIKDSKSRQEIVSSVVEAIKYSGFNFQGIIDSPIEGGSGNKEYLAYFIYELEK